MNLEYIGVGATFVLLITLIIYVSGAIMTLVIGEKNYSFENCMENGILVWFTILMSIIILSVAVAILNFMGV